MKKTLLNTKFLSFILAHLLALGAHQHAWSQCNNPSQFGTVTAPTNSTVLTITTCAFAGEYSTINSAVAGSTYQFTASGGSGNYLTVRQGTPGGAVLAFGFTPISATCTVSGPLYLHYNTNAACGTDASCHTGTIQCTSCVSFDPCASIANLTCGTSTTATLSGSGSWSPGNCGFSTPGTEKVYSFTPTTTGVHTLNVTSTNSGGYIDYFYKAASGGCSSTGWTCIKDVFSASSWTIGTLTAGITYYFLLDPETTASVTQTFKIDCPAPFDPCANIATLSCATPTSATLSGTGVWSPGNCGFSTPGTEKVYSFTPTTTGTHTLNVTSTNSAGYIDYFYKAASGGCSSTGWTCIKDVLNASSWTIGTLTAGTTYYILMDPETTVSVTQTFQIDCPPAGSPPPCLASPTSPTNGQSNVCPSGTQTLSWPVSVGATSYDVYFGTSSTPPFVANVVTNSFVATTPANGLYYWQIRPRNSFGPATGCAIWSFTKQDITPPSITCPASVTANNNPATACSAVVTYGAITATDNCAAPSITLIGGLPSNSVFPAGVTTVTYRATDPSNNSATCSFTVTVKDVTLPVITCPANIVKNNDPGLCSAVTSFPNATATDNCSGVTVSLLSGLPSGSVFPVGTTTNVFRAVDASTNSATCSFTIKVNDVEKPIVTCPAALNLPNDGGQCGRNIAWVGQATYTDNCGAIQNQNNSTGYFPVGTHLVTHTVTDIYGNAATCGQTVTIYDAEYPNIACPANIVVLTDEGDCVAHVNYSATGQDNCPGASIAFDIDPQSAFQPGLTNVTATITDAVGNASSCTFQIRVNTRKEVCNDFDDDCDGLTDEAEEWQKVAKLIPGDGGAQDQYGVSVDIHGNYAIVGSNQKIPNGPALGAAYILQRSANGWVPAAKLQPNDLEPGDLFGASVTIYKDFAAVGAPQDDSQLGNEGAVYIYYRNPSEDWVFLKKITAGDPDAADNFGSSVALNGDRLLVGASLDDESGQNAGAAYIFAKDQGGADNWGQVAKMLAATGAADDNMGVSAALDGDYAVVGAPGVDGLFQNSGAAYVFGRNQGGANAWGQVSRMRSPQAGQNDNFGGSVGVSGSWAIVGADQNDLKGTNAGAAFIFYRNHNGILNSWGQHNILTDYNGAAGDRYGSAVAIDGDYAGVSARGDNPFGSGSGRGFVYLRLDDNWILASQLADGAGQANDNLGSSIAISDRSIIMGAPLDNNGAVVDQGSAVVFEGICADQLQQNPADRSNVGTDNTDIRCFPVPFSEVLNVEVRGVVANDVQVTVLNTLGQTVAELYHGSVESDMIFQWRPGAHMGQGMYFLRMSTAGKIMTKTIVLAR